MKNIKLLFLSAVFLGFVFSQPVFAIGQMTKPIVIKNILRGQTVTETIILFNSENKEVTYYLEANGGIEGWVNFYKTDDVKMQNPIVAIKLPAKGQVQVIAKFQVPATTPNGQYEGQVAVTTRDSSVLQNTGNANAVVLEAIGRAVVITVTDKEVIDLAVSVIPSTYGITGGEPLKIKIDYYNNGNVSMKPDVQLTIKKGGNSVFNAIFPYPESENPIDIKTMKTLSYVEWQSTGQENGKYTAEVKILHNGSTVAEKSFKFSIGYFSNNIWVGAASFFGGGNTILGILIFGAILIGLFFLIKMLKEKGLIPEKATAVFNNLRKLF